MKYFPFLGMLLLLSGSAGAQTTPIIIRVDRGANVTQVQTNRLNVIDQPSQFLQIEFSGSYASVGPPSSPPYEILINIYSFATDALYRQHSRSKLVAYADGEQVPIGLAIYDLWYVQQTMNLNEKVSQSPSFDREKNLPPGTRVAKTHDLSNIVHESLVVEPVSIDVLVRLAQAQRVEMQLGSTRFQLNDIHMDRLRLFAKSVIPPGYKLETIALGAGPGNSSSPSDANGTPLKQTMEWLGSRLSSLSATQGNRQHIDFESSALAKCQLKYSQSNTTGTQKMSHSANFGDLDPEATNVSETPFATVLRYATKDNELRIKEDSYSQTPYSQHEEKYLYHAREVKLKKDGRTGELREAFIHAIRLCQSMP